MLSPGDYSNREQPSFAYLYNFDVNLQFLGNTAQYQVKRRTLLVACHNYLVFDYEFN
jgi:hypothetical protein